MKVFDSHCHLTDPAFQNDFDQVLERMHSADVRAALIPGIFTENAVAGIHLAQRHACLAAAVGIHPHNAGRCSERDLAILKEWAGQTVVKAWGEIGLDFNRMFAPRADQERWFRRQLAIADDLGLPLIFHERDSQGRFLEILTQTHHERRRGVVHCFSGNRAELDAYLSLGYHIGITGIVTHKERGGQLRELVPAIPVDRLLVETDAPYLTPTPERNRFRRNEPAFVRTVLLKLAQIRNESAADLADTIWTNTRRLFNWPDEHG